MLTVPKVCLEKRNQVGTKCLPQFTCSAKKKEIRNYKSAQDTLLGKMFFFLTLMYMKKKYKYVEDFCGIK